MPINGTNGNDTLDGTNANDVIFGLDGNDTISSGNGNDVVDAGSGNDIVDAGNGNDVVDGGLGDDTLNGGNGNDALNGGEGNDSLSGGNGDDVMNGGEGNDNLSGGNGDDVMNGGAGNDTLSGGNGNDVAVYVMGENAGSTDVYEGGNGNDTLRIVLTGAEWMQSNVRANIMSFLDFLDGGARGTFNFTAFNLSARGFEHVEVIVDGIAVDLTDHAVNAVDDSFTVGEDSVLGSSVIGNDSAPDGAAHVTLVQNVTQGLLSLNNDGSFTFDTNGQFNHLAVGETATQTFEYQVEDFDGDMDTATATITIQGVNDAPVAKSDSAFAVAGGSVVINVLANDEDVDGDTLGVLSAGTAANGVVTVLPDGTVQYTPNAGFSGEDQFTYEAADPSGASSTGTVSLIVGKAAHEQVGGDVFLQGNYMEIGVSSAGSLGTANAAPSGFHPINRSNISFRIDQDGWDSGLAPVSGDFTLPGTPVDGFVVAMNGLNFVNDERDGFKEIDTTTTDTSVGSDLSARTTGVVGGALAFTQDIVLESQGTYYTTTITLTNTSGATVNDVRFMRTFDPDQDVDLSGTFNTFDDVRSNPGVENNLAISRADGAVTGASVNLIAFDGDARASNFGFANRDAYDASAFNSPVDANGTLGDRAITLTFDIGSLAPGETVTKTFYTSLDSRAGSDDMPVGTSGADLIDAKGGNDIIIGLGGDDTLTDGAGDDKFVFTKMTGDAVVTDFTAGAGTDDVIDLSGFDVSTALGAIAGATQIGADTLIDLGLDQTITLVNVNLASLHSSDFLVA
jgi:hypothetical protein